MKQQVEEKEEDVLLTGVEAGEKIDLLKKDQVHLIQEEMIGRLRDLKKEMTEMTEAEEMIEMIGRPRDLKKEMTEMTEAEEMIGRDLDLKENLMIKKVHLKKSRFRD